MKHKFIFRPAFKMVLSLTGSALLILSLFFFLYHYDNKYTTKATPAQGKNAFLVPETGYCFLTDDWEFYPDALLQPEDFSEGTPAPCYRIRIGEFSDLSLFHEDKNPYGHATYRIHLRGSGSKSLYIQEPLCASRIYVNGVLLGETGNVSADAYRPLIQDKIYSFSMNGDTELIIQTANLSHYYGGLYYPPAIGETDSIGHMIVFRMIFYGFLCFTALALSLFCVMLWLGKSKQRNTAAFYFGLLCFAFAVWVCYPFLRFFGIPSAAPLYALQDMSGLLVTYCAVRIAILLFVPKLHGSIYSLAATISLGMCGVGIVIPLFILPAFPSFSQIYGPLISWYKIAAAIFLLLMACYACLLGRSGAGLKLAAVTSYGTGLLANILCINRYEPILTGWQDEFGTYFMVLLFAVMMVLRSREMVMENLRLNSRLREEVEKQTRHLNQLLDERGQLMAELGHDLKSPLTSLSNMAQIIRINSIFVDSETMERMQTIENQCTLMADRLRSLQEFGETKVTSRFETISLNRFLEDFYHDNKPVVELSGPDFTISLTNRPCSIPGNSKKLRRALENLVFNACDFTPPEGSIALTLTQEEHFAVIRLKDSGCGITPENLPKIFDSFYTTRSEEGGQGLGLAIVRNTVLEHKGEITVKSKAGEGTVFTIRLPLSDTV